MGILNTLSFIWQHPLSRSRKVDNMRTFLSWQIGSRLVPGPVIAAFVGTSRLIVSTGETGATGNLYTGLAELPEMAFLGHVLRPDDLFVDVGANIGAYTILAAGWAGARVVALEPARQAFARLCENVRLNDLAASVETHMAAVGDNSGRAQLTLELGTMNHLLRPGESSAAATVDMVTLDEVLGERSPYAIKVDVEGFEVPVFAGARKTLTNPALQALVVEMNGSGERFGYDEGELHETIIAAGFTHISYDAVHRQIRPGAISDSGDNRIYVRDSADLRERIRTATPMPLRNGVKL